MVAYDGGWTVRFRPIDSGASQSGFNAAVDMRWSATGRRGAATATGFDPSNADYYAEGAPRVTFESLRRNINEAGTVVSETTPQVAGQFQNEGLPNRGEGYKGMAQDGLGIYRATENFPTTTTIVDPSMNVANGQKYAYYMRVRTNVKVDAEDGAAYAVSDMHDPEPNVPSGIINFYLQVNELKLSSSDGTRFVGC